MDVKEQIQLKTRFDDNHANESPAVVIKNNQDEAIFGVGETGKSDWPLSNEFLLPMYTG